MFHKMPCKDSKKFRSPDGRFRLVISHCRLSGMCDLCSKSHPLETGGVLTGYYNEGHDTAIVTGAGGPPPDSERGRTRFYRGTQGLGQVLADLWRKREHYLGEWHYHPGGSAQPSAADVRQMQDIAKDDDAHCPEPILLVIGENNTVTAHVFPRNESAIELTAEYAIQFPRGCK